MPIWDNRVRVSVLSVAERFRMDNRAGYVPPIKWFARKPLFLCQETVRYLVERFGVRSVADIFSGSGTIPLACILQGVDVEAFDLNPVACSITEAVVRILPRYGDDIVLDVARVIRSALKDFRYRMGRYYSAVDVSIPFERVSIFKDVVMLTDGVCRVSPGFHPL